MSTLVFLHGVGGGSGAWAAQLTFFEAKGYRCHAWDQPGYGTRPMMSPYDWAHIAQALEETLDDLRDGPVVLIGHSMGGFAAQEFIARYPGRANAVALCFTTSSFGGSGSAFAQSFIAARIAPLDAGDSMADIAGRLVPSMRGSRSEDAGAGLAQRIMSAVAPSTYRQAVALLTTFDRRSDLARIDIPALVLAGEEDKTAPAATMERMAERIRGADYRVLPGCGHLGPMDQPAEFNQALLSFLQRNDL